MMPLGAVAPAPSSSGPARGFAQFSRRPKGPGRTQVGATPYRTQGGKPGAVRGSRSWGQGLARWTTTTHAPAPPLCIWGRVTDRTCTWMDGGPRRQPQAARLTCCWRVRGAGPAPVSLPRAESVGMRQQAFHFGWLRAAAFLAGAFLAGAGCTHPSRVHSSAMASGTSTVAPGPWTCPLWQTWYGATTVTVALMTSAAR